MTLLSGYAAAETHRRLTRAVAAFRAFSRRRIGRPAAVVVADTSSNGGDHHRGAGVGEGGNMPVDNPPELAPAPPSVSTKARPSAAHIADMIAPEKAADVVVGVGGHTTPSPQTRPGITAVHAPTTRGLSVDLAAASAQTPVEDDGGFFSHAPILASSPISRPLSTDDSNSAVPWEEETISFTAAYHDGASNGGGGFNRTISGSSDGNPLTAARAAASAAAAHARVAQAAAEAAAMSAAASASVAAEGAALAEENTLVEALREVRGVLMTGRKDPAGAGAEVGRIAAGVGLAPALLGALRALKKRGDDGGSSASGSTNNGLDLAKQVKSNLPVLVSNSKV